MSAPPEFVKRLEDIIAEQKSVTRRLMTLLHDMSLGTASAARADGPCRCNGLGVVSTEQGSIPCVCSAGQPFRLAAAAQERKRDNSREYTGEFRAQRFNSLGGRDLAAGREE